MKKNTSTIIFSVLLIAVFLGAFWFSRTRAIAGWHDDKTAWLGDVSDEIVQSEQEFIKWVSDNKQLLMRQRNELAQLLENPASDDASILRKVDQIGATQTELLGTIGKHINSMRSFLPDAQKDLLRGFCSQCSGSGKHRYGSGMHSQQGQTQDQKTKGSGNGFRRGQGKGCCGLTEKLQLTQEQLAICQQKDPLFEQDVRTLRNNLFDERQRLFSLLENGQDSNGQLTEQFDRLAEAYNSLEKRLINYVIVMRPYFTAEQQKQIIGMCRNNCRNDKCTQM